MRLREREQQEDVIIDTAPDGVDVLIVKCGLLSERARIALSRALVLVDKPSDEVTHPDELAVGQPAK